MIDPYELLGLERDADNQAIRNAYRKAAKSAHPDSGGDPEQFARLQVAYELLKDPVRRKVYDDTGYDPQLADARDLKGLADEGKKRIGSGVIALARPVQWSPPPVLARA